MDAPSSPSCIWRGVALSSTILAAIAKALLEVGYPLEEAGFLRDRLRPEIETACLEAFALHAAAERQLLLERNAEIAALVTEEAGVYALTLHKIRYAKK